MEKFGRNKYGAGKPHKSYHGAMYHPNIIQLKGFAVKTQVGLLAKSGIVHFGAWQEFNSAECGAGTGQRKQELRRVRDVVVTCRRCLTNIFLDLDRAGLLGCKR